MLQEEIVIQRFLTLMVDLYFDVCIHLSFLNPKSLVIKTLLGATVEIKNFQLPLKLPIFLSLMKSLILEIWPALSVQLLKGTFPLK